MCIFPQNIQKYNSTNIKTSLSTAALAFDSIKNLGTNLNPSTLAAYSAQLSGLTATQQKMALSTTNLTLAQQKQVLAYIAETAAAKSLTAQQIAELSIDQKQALINAGLITQEQIETGVTLELSEAQLQKILTSEAVSIEDKKLILGALGVTGANLTETSSWKVLGASIKAATAAMLKWLFTNPVGWATLAVGAIVVAITAYNKWGDTLENNRKKLEELKSEAQTISSDLQTFNSELQTTQQRISELEGKDSLTFTEAEELENLKKQNNELQRSIGLLKLKEKENNKGKNKSFVGTMEKDVYSTDYYKDGRDGDKIKKGQAGRDEYKTTTTEHNYITQQFSDRKKLLDDLTDAETEEERKRIQDQIDKIDKYLSDRNKQFTTDADGISYIDSPTTEDDKKVNEWLDYINDFQDKMAVAIGGENAKENAFNRLVDNWKFDELLDPIQKLGKEGKVTLDDLKSRMSDPAFAEFISKLKDIGVISDTTDGSLRYLANAFNGTATSARNYVTALKGNDLDNFIKNLDEEAKALGITKSELAKLTAAHVIFNKTELSTEQQQIALKNLANAIGATSAEMKYLLRLFNAASGNFDAIGATTLTDVERASRIAHTRAYLKEKYGIDLSPVEIPEKEDVSPYSPSGGGDGGGGGSEKNEALDYYLKNVENLYKIRQNETQYINDLQWALDNLVKTEDERLDIIGKQNEAYKTLADNQIKDLEHQIDLAKELYGEDYDVTGYYAQVQKTASDEANRYREFARKELGYYNEGITDEQKAEIDADIEKTDEIQGLQKTWWDAQNSKLDFYSKQHENIIRDIEHARDMALETNPLADTTSYYRQMQEAYHKEAERLRALDPEKYKEEIQELQLAWWEAQDAIVDWKWQNSNNWIEERNTKGDWSLYGDSEYEAWQRVAKWLREEYPNEIEKIKEADQKAIDARYQHSLDWIDERNTYNDWALFDDSEVDAWERVIKWLNEEYPDEIEKIKEAEKSLFEARKEQFDKATNFGNTYLDSTKTLLQSYYDVTNSVAEAQHEINKELETSKTMYEYLDEETRKLLFNQDDYNELSEELLDIQYKADKLQRQYKRDLDNATLETIEKITSNYRMQYETLMKSYEIAKADLEIAKKKQKLNNVLNERNVRMFINGSWQWVANTEDVANAKSELADAEYAKRVEDAGLAQQNSINELTKKQDALGVVIKQFENGVIDLDTAVYKAEMAIGRLPDALESMFGKALSSGKSSSSGGSSSASSSSANRVIGYDKNTDYMAKILASDNQMDVIEYNAARNAKILGEDMESSDIKVMTESEALDIWKKAKGYAIGTRYTSGGLTKMGEDGDEFYIPANGRLIPINQPTIGNIPSGGVVFNREQMKNLRTMWDMSNLKFTGSSNLAGSAKPQQVDQSVDNRIIINGMTVDSESADGQALISALRRYVGNH